MAKYSIAFKEKAVRRTIGSNCETSTAVADDLGKWLRENGLHSEHLHQFEQEIREMVEKKNDKTKDENNKLKKVLKEKDKEIRRKDKTIAELAALITLKKKAEDIWGDPEDD